MLAAGSKSMRFFGSTFRRKYLSAARPIISYRVAFSSAEVVELAELLAHAAGLAHHLVDQVVGIHHGAFAALHLAAGQVHHAVAQVEELIGPGEAELLQDDEQDLEVVVLLVAHRVDELERPGYSSKRLIAVPMSCVMYTLVPSRRSSTFLIKALGGVVHPHGAILLVEHTLLQALQHIVLAQHVGLALVVVLVELHAHAPCRWH